MPIVLIPVMPVEVWFAAISVLLSGSALRPIRLRVIVLQTLQLGEGDALDAFTDCATRRVQLRPSFQVSHPS
jgi:hypothetical protein